MVSPLNYLLGALSLILVVVCIVLGMKSSSLEDKIREYEANKVVAEESALFLRKSNDLAIGKKNAEIETINAKLASLRSELRKRPSRATASQAGSTCTGRELPREDGEFLAGEAARAERILKERNYYYERYEESRQMLERLNNGKTRTE